MNDTTHSFTFGELWALAMEDEDFAAGRIDATEFFRRLLGKGDREGYTNADKKTAG